MISRTRQEALDILERGHVALSTLFRQLSSEAMIQPATVGCGQWSAKDLQSHIAFWEELAIEALEDWRRGLRPGVEQILAAGASGTDAANASNQERSITESVGEVSRRAEAAQESIVNAIRAMSDEEWNARPFYPAASKAELGKLLGTVLGAPTGPFEHAFAHLQDLKTYVEASRADEKRNL